MKNEKKNEKLVRVVFCVIDDFANPHFLRKSHIGYMTESSYETAVKQNRPVFDVGTDYFAETFPQTMEK